MTIVPPSTHLRTLFPVGKGFFPVPGTIFSPHCFRAIRPVPRCDAPRNFWFGIQPIIVRDDERYKRMRNFHLRLISLVAKAGAELST